MGKRGRPKTPTPVLAIRGSWRAKDRAKREPQAPEGLPDKPLWISSSAIPTPEQIWDKLVDDLDKIGTLHQTDGNAMGRYCSILSEWCKAKAFIEKHGDTYSIKDDDGNVKFFAFPQVIPYRHLLTQILRLEQEFGLTPSSRAGLAAAPKKTDEDVEARYFG